MFQSQQTWSLQQINSQHVDIVVFLPFTLHVRVKSDPCCDAPWDDAHDCTFKESLYSTHPCLILLNKKNTSPVMTKSSMYGHCENIGICWISNKSCGKEQGRQLQSYSHTCILNRPPHHNPPIITYIPFSIPSSRYKMQYADWHGFVDGYTKSLSLHIIMLVCKLRILSLMFHSPCNLLPKKPSVLDSNY